MSIYIIIILYFKYHLVHIDKIESYDFNIVIVSSDCGDDNESDVSDSNMIKISICDMDS